jgi:phosphatidylserine/phosphatidylglycerophosphate/cardiolipin synthase-like enzyme
MVHFETKEFEFHSGRGVGLIISDLLSQAKQKIWVCSPWISEKYADYLLKKKQEGLDIRLITTNDYSINSNALKKLIVPKKVENLKLEKILKYLSYPMFLFGFILLVLRQFVLSILFFIVGVFSFFFKKREIEYEALIDILILDKNKRLTHSKIYIIDDKVVIGSPNFTESGLNINFETIFSFSKKEFVEKLIKTFEEIKNNPEIDYVDINDVGINMNKKIVETNLHKKSVLS